MSNNQQIADQIEISIRNLARRADNLESHLIETENRNDQLKYKLDRLEKKISILLGNASNSQYISDIYNELMSIINDPR